MKRRSVVALGLVTAAGLGASYWLRPRPVQAGELVSRSICSTNLGPSQQRYASGHLSFAGTRLFKEGFLDELGKEYQRATDHRIEVLGGGCDDGTRAVRTGQALIGGLCCPVESSRATGLDHITVAHDLKVVVAHPEVSVADLGWSELVGIMTGAIQNWREVGGIDRPVAAVLHDHCPEHLEPVRRALLNERPGWSGNALFVKTDQKHLDTVARFRTAVGINSWILAEPYVKAGRLKVLSINGIEPTISNAADRGYPLVGPMNMIFERWEARTMAPFFDFLFGPRGQEIIGRRLVPIARSTGLERPLQYG